MRLLKRNKITKVLLRWADGYRAAAWPGFVIIQVKCGENGEKKTAEISLSGLCKPWTPRRGWSACAPGIAHAKLVYHRLMSLSRAGPKPRRMVSEWEQVSKFFHYPQIYFALVGIDKMRS